MGLPEMGGVSGARSAILAFGRITRIGFVLAIFARITCKKNIISETFIRNVMVVNGEGARRD